MGLLDNFKNGNGMFGLGGLSGAGGTPIQGSLLGGFYDPAVQRKQMLKQALLGAGIGMLQGGIGSTGQVLGQAFAGGLQGANTAKDDYIKQAMFQRELQADNEKKALEAQARQRADQQRVAQQAFIQSLPQNQRGYAAAFPDQAGAAFGKQLFPKPASETNYGMTPQYGVDAQGNPVLLQMGDNGTVTQPKMPNGVTLSKQPIKLDAGTHWVLLDPITRQPVGTIQKDLAGAAAQTQIGEAQGKSQAAAPADMQAAQNALGLIDSIRNDPNKAWGTGVSSMLNSIPGSPGKDFQRKLDQAQAGAFMTGIQSMRGMGALSDAEGKKASDAVARMDTSTSEQAFDAALNDYEAIVKQGMARAQNRASGQFGVQPIPAPQGGAPDFSTMSDDQLKAILNGQ